MDQFVPLADDAAAPHDADAAASLDGPRRWRLFARAASLLLLAAVLVPVVVRMTGWEAGPLVYAVSFLPWVTVACLVPLALAILARAWRIAAASLVPLALCVAWMAPLYVVNASSEDAAAADPALRVATANLLFGQADPEAVVRMVREGSLDMLAVEELTPSAVDALREAGIERLLPYSELRPKRGASGTGLWSRLPFDAVSAVDFPGMEAVKVTVSVDGESLTVYAVHPSAPGPFDHDAWSTEWVALNALLAREQGPVVVAGDFNTTRDHRAFRDLEALGFSDAVDQAGAGFLPTFPNGGFPMPVVAIDHVLTRGSQLTAVAVCTIVIPHTDHRALVVTYVWQD